MNIKIHACVGGTAVRDDIRTLQDGVNVVVGTPGRVYDMIQRRALRLDSVQLFVLDEGERLKLIRYYFNNINLLECRSVCSLSFPLFSSIYQLFSSSLPFCLTIYLSFIHFLSRTLYFSLSLPFPAADEMLSRGFKEQIYDVFKFMPETVQCTIFSATMPLEVLEVRVS